MLVAWNRTSKAKKIKDTQLRATLASTEKFLHKDLVDSFLISQHNKAQQELTEKKEIQKAEWKAMKSSSKWF